MVLGLRPEKIMLILRQRIHMYTQGIRVVFYKYEINNDVIFHLTPSYCLYLCYACSFFFKRYKQLVIMFKKVQVALIFNYF